MTGYFIVVEGLEGAGKTTAMATIKRCLSMAAVPELIVTREPGGTQVGDMVRTLIKANDHVLDSRAELLLFYAARRQLMAEVIRPALKRGALVLADRFELSTFAYQGGGRGLDEAMLTHLSNFCLESFQPDLTLFLDVPPSVGLERAKNRGKLDRMEQESISFFNAVYGAYHQRLKKMSHVVMIDALKPLPVVEHYIRTAIERFLKKHYV